MRKKRTEALPEEPGMSEITRFERIAGAPGSTPNRSDGPPRTTPPPIPPAARSSVEQANLLAYGPSEKSFVNRAALTFAVLATISVAGGLGYYVFSEGQNLLDRKSVV